MVVCWVAGFDVIYALQDLEVDQRDGFFGIPARFGTDGALSISRLLHVFAVILGDRNFKLRFPHHRY